MRWLVILSCCVACGGAAGTSSSLPALAPVGDAGAAAGAGTAADGGVASDDDAGLPAAPRATLAGCPLFGQQSEWTRDVSQDPVDANSAAILAFMNAGLDKLQPDFGGPYGNPYVVVHGDQPRVPMAFTYATESDPGPYPYPQQIPVQDNPDHHAAVVDADQCVLYETYATQADGNGGYRADSGARFDLTSALLRPDGWTAATAAGLPYVPGLARVDEAIDRGEILHALAFIAGPTAHAYVHPATHAAGTSNDPAAPPMGLRVRLRADYDLSGMSGASRAIARALQRYGMFLTDNANLPFWALAGERSDRWDVQELNQLKSIPASAFEVVKLGEAHPGL